VRLRRRRANYEFTLLLCLNAQAVTNQLLGRCATGVTVQNGIFLYVIEGS
jgi:hypothetical protein